MAVPQNIKQLLYDPATPHQHVHAKELKAGIQTDIVYMLTAALLTRAKRKKQPKCPSTGE